MTLDVKLLFLHTADAFRTWTSFLASKRVLARFLSTFLCSVVLVVRPFSALGGTDAFLVLTLKELVFSVQDSLAQQLELTALNILGAFMGIGMSTLGKFIAAQYPEDSSRSRATCAIFLVLISFVGTYVTADPRGFCLCVWSLMLVGCRSWSGEEPSPASGLVYAHILLRLHMDIDRRHWDTFGTHP